jgi:nitroreductase
MSSFGSGVVSRGRRLLRGAFASVAGPYARERRQVESGVARYNQLRQRSHAVYELRRHVHMIEKGLSMRPRRATFALEYIEGTIRTYAAVVGKQGPTYVGEQELLWMQSVLAEYFDATRAAEHPALAGLESEFIAATAGPVDRAHGPHRPELASSPVNVEALSDLAHSRRSVRWFRPEPVPRELIDTAVRIGAEAPTACNRQPYRFIVFDDASEVARVARVPMGTRGYAQQIQGIIVVVGDLSAIFDKRDRHLIYVDSCLASMGLLLGLESQGVGSCVINWPDMPDKENEMAGLLELDPHEKVIMLIAYGWPDPDGLVPFSAKADLDAVRKYGQLRGTRTP